MYSLDIRRELAGLWAEVAALKSQLNSLMQTHETFTPPITPIMAPTVIPEPCSTSPTSSIDTYIPQLYCPSRLSLDSGSPWPPTLSGIPEYHGLCDKTHLNHIHAQQCPSNCYDNPHYLPARLRRNRQQRGLKNSCLLWRQNGCDSYHSPALMIPPYPCLKRSYPPLFLSSPPCLLSKEELPHPMVTKEVKSMRRHWCLAMLLYTNGTFASALPSSTRYPLYFMHHLSCQAWPFDSPGTWYPYAHFSHYSTLVR